MTRIFLVCCSLLMLPGCFSRHPISYEIVPRSYPPREALAPYRASKSIYDQGKTIALCDVLWVTPTVCSLYRQELASRGIEDMRCAQLNEETYAFYVLLAPSDRDLDIGLNDPYAYWSAVLEIGGRQYTPMSVEKVPLPKEYEYLFAVEAVRFRTIYYLTFKVPRNEQGTECALCLHAARYQFCAGFSSG